MGRRLVRLAAAAVAMAVAWAAPARAQVEQHKLVSSAVATIERLRTDQGHADTLPPVLERAKAVLIVPNLFKPGFILGGEYGTGVMLARRADGSWSYPAFYTMGAGSLGFQAGIQDAQVLFAIMTDKALAALMKNAVKFGADLALAVVVGGGVEAATTTNLGADVYAFSHSLGLFGGGSLEGALVKPRQTWNAAYYGAAVTPEAILLDDSGSVANPQAEPLRDVLGR